MKKVGIIGLGLIGGSMGLALRQTGRYRVYGDDISAEHLRVARERGLIDEPLTPELISAMDGIVLAVPVDHLPSTALYYLNRIHDEAWITDTGSIKHPLARAIENHPRRGRFVLAHPIAGTEYSGPRAAVEGLFKGKINILSDTFLSDEDALEAVKNLFARDLEMEIAELPSRMHDQHIAYVSHLSHVSAFMLGKTVLDVETDEKNIFLMAGSGFASTVRLAKSSPQTWTPIFLENKAYLIPVLEKYIRNMELFIALLEDNDAEGIRRLLAQINQIGQIIDRIHKKHGKQ